VPWVDHPLMRMRLSNQSMGMACHSPLTQAIGFRGVSDRDILGVGPWAEQNCWWSVSCAVVFNA
jgi:hypothetical protein